MPLGDALFHTAQILLNKNQNLLLFSYMLRCRLRTPGTSTCRHPHSGVRILIARLKCIFYHLNKCRGINNTFTVLIFIGAVNKNFLYFLWT